MKVYDVKENGNSYSPVGCGIVREEAKIFTKIGSCCTINNNSRIDFVGGSYDRVGLPTEAALKVFAEKLCGQPEDDKSAFLFEKEQKKQIKMIAQLDFSSLRKMQSSVVTGYEAGEKTSLLMGAPEKVIANSSSFLNIFDDSQEMTMEDRKELMKYVDDFSQEGLRCLALAEIPNAGKLAGLTD